MKLKIALATATALGLCMGTAWAGNGNVTKSVQTGESNDILVQQNGNNNIAGRNAYQEMLIQNGDSNSISVEQNGQGNSIGVGWVNGVIQTDDQNVAIINQDTGNTAYTQNRVDTVLQNGVDGATSTSNRLTITQSRNDSAGEDAKHLVHYVKQTNTGGAENSISIEQLGWQDHWYGGSRGNTINSATQNGADNTLTVHQDGNGPIGSNGFTGPNNKIQSVSQIGLGNNGAIQQDGHDNFVQSLSQNGAGNGASLTFTGNNNGKTGFTGVAAGVTNVALATAVQHGDGNALGYLATGDNNSFGFTQDGSGNWINGTSSGYDHQIAIYEHGDGNSVNFTQTGTGNNAGLSMDGDNNVLNTRQDQSGISGNNMSVTITGNKNNNYALTGNALAGDALTVRNVIRADLGSTTFGQGDLFQDGSNNTLALNVTSSSNAFATYQSGNNNTVNGSIGGGNANQAVVAQIGNSNTAAFTQTGGGNNVGISQ